MARKPSDIVQPNLRIREELRRRLEKEATKNRVSLNVEMTRRLERSLDQEHQLTSAGIAADLSNLWDRYGPAFEQLNRQGDLIRATEALLKQLPPDTEASPAIKRAADKVRQVLTSIDTEAVQLPRRMHTTGADS
jgi:hypothetical protein